MKNVGLHQIIPCVPRMHSANNDVPSLSKCKLLHAFCIHTANRMLTKAVKHLFSVPVLQ